MLQHPDTLRRRVSLNILFKRSAGSSCWSFPQMARDPRRGVEAPGGARAHSACALAAYYHSSDTTRIAHIRASFRLCKYSGA